MSRYQVLFDSLKQKKQGAFVPFVMLGDPDLESSFEIICTMISSGADALELGFPFSDPIADGPTIQKAAIRALSSNVTPARCFELIRRIRERYVDTPIGLLLYCNLVLRPGVAHFYRAAAEAGVDSVLLADVPLRESEPFRRQAELNGIDHILIAPPNASDETLITIARQSRGYVYLLGRAGVTGSNVKADSPLGHTLAILRAHQAAPAIVGFGISHPHQVREYVAAGAAGAIAGSSIVGIVEQNLDDPHKLHTELAAYCGKMKEGTRLSRS